MEGRLISIFQNFVSGFKDRLNALFLAQFVIVVSKQFPNVEDSIVFISKEKDDLSSTNNRKRDPAAITLLKLQLALCKLNIGLEKDCKLVLDEVESELKGSFDAVVHSKFYEVLMYFHKAKSHASLFFKNALLFLGYTDLDSISHQDQIALASDLALSALVGEDIFNFGELVIFPLIFKSKSKVDADLSNFFLFSFNIKF